MPRPMPKKMSPKTNASQKSWELKTSDSWLICGIGP